MEISPQFKRAVETELKRLQEERPTFGQGGAEGGVIRRLDQQLAQANSRVKRLDSDLQELTRKYWATTNMSTGMNWKDPKLKKAKRRVRKVADALEETESIMNELKEALYKAVNAKG